MAFGIRELTRSHRENITLEQLVQEHDMSMYGTGQPSQLNAYHMLRRLAHISVINEFPSLDGLWKHLDQMDLSSLDRLRPQWDTYFMVDHLVTSTGAKG